MRNQQPTDAGTPKQVSFRLVFGPFSVCYALLVVYQRALQQLTFDRYLIPLLPAIVIPLLWHYQRHARRTLPAVSWILLAVFALYGVLTTHDYLAAARARLAAATAVVGSGIPRHQISAGIEYDALTQLELEGHINNPGTATFRPQPGRLYPVSPPYWFWERAPRVEPRYLVVYSRARGLSDSCFPPVQFDTWLPPFHRQIFTQMAAPADCAPHPTGMGDSLPGSR